MAMNLIRTQAGDGIFVNLIKDDRFKHDRISVNFILPLSRETATGYALLPFLMQRGYAGCSDFTAFARKLDELYGATVSGRVSKAGSYQIITLTITHVDTTSDLRYARVYVSALNCPDEKGLLKGLKSAAGYLRHELGSRIDLRYTPELQFFIDDSIAYGAHILDMLNHVKPADPRNADIVLPEDRED